MPFSDLSPLQFSSNASGAYGNSSASKQLQHSAQRKLNFNKPQPAQQQQQQQNQRRLYFNSNRRRSGHRDDDEDDENDSTCEFNRHRDSDNNEDDDDDDDDDENDDKELLKDFDVIEVIPGFGEPPKSNQEYEIKCLRKKSNQSYRHYATPPPQPIEIKEDHFKKPLTKIDVLKAPDNYPCPLNSYCVQEISLNWFLYGGHDFANTAASTSSASNQTGKLMPKTIMKETSHFGLKIILFATFRPSKRSLSSKII
jgi:hypothetical protein